MDWQARFRNERRMMVCLFSFPFLQCAQPRAPGESLGSVQHHPLQEWPKAAAGGLCQPPLLRHQGICNHPRGHSQVMGHKGLRGEEVAPFPSCLPPWPSHVGTKGLGSSLASASAPLCELGQAPSPLGPWFPHL